MARVTIGVDPYLVIDTPNQTFEVIKTGGDDVFLPPESFDVNTVASRAIDPTPMTGSISFTVKTKYSHPDAIGAWIYRVTVNGIARARWDGASHKQPVSVRLENVQQRSIVAVEVVALSARRGYRTWSEATRAHIENIQFKESEISGDSLRVEITPVDNRFLPYDHKSALFYDINELLTRDVSDQINDGPQRLDVVTDHGVFPLLVVRKQVASRTVILSNGAVDLHRSGGSPIFQRSSWANQIEGHQIYVCDPGTVGPRALSLSWGQLTENYWAVPDLAQVVRRISTLLGIGNATDRLYFGSSAGGFMALALASGDDGCRVIINNAQFDWTRWMAGGVNALRSARFRNALPAVLRERYPERTNALNLLREGRGPRRVDYLYNLASVHDREVDVPKMRAFLFDNPHFREVVKVMSYWDPVAGHNPLPRDLTTVLLNSPLGVDPRSIDPIFTRDLAIQDDSVI